MDEDELRRLAKTTGFDLATLEKDYALTWLLSGTYSKDSKLRKLLILKGGTAIRKVYFPEWRLSEDLDFTVLRRITAQQVREYFDLVFNALTHASNITYAFDAFSANPRSILADVQFVGPLRFKNRIGHDISLREKLVEEPKRKRVKPEYADVPEFTVLVYSLNEILVEKIRSILQRGKTRDYYDVWRLTDKHEFDLRKIRKLLEEKCRITRVEFKPDLLYDETRLGEAKKFWTIALARLTKDLPDFDSVISELRSRLAPLKE
jgi:predicted nucleotidyltransferase component of viral defense system